jgi:hypothetical protein
LGPQSFQGIEREFDETMPKGYIPDFRAELDNFAINPFTKERLMVESLIEFLNYDDDGFIELVNDDKGNISVYALIFSAQNSVYRKTFLVYRRWRSDCKN